MFVLRRVLFLMCVPVSALSVSLPPRGVARVFGFSASGRPFRLVSVFCVVGAYFGEQANIVGAFCALLRHGLSSSRAPFPEA